MLIRLLYVSRAVGPQTSTVTAMILKTARAHNRGQDITGVLCQGQDLYLQVLEGERSRVNALYARILADPRHCDVELLHFEENDRRRFPDWSMALVDLSADDAMVQMRHPEFDPYSARGGVVLSMIDDLVRGGQRIELPEA